MDRVLPEVEFAPRVAEAIRLELECRRQVEELVRRGKACDRRRVAFILLSRERDRQAQEFGRPKVEAIHQERERDHREAAFVLPRLAFTRQASVRDRRVRASGRPMQGLVRQAPGHGHREVVLGLPRLVSIHPAPVRGRPALVCGRLIEGLVRRAQEHGHRESWCGPRLEECVRRAACVPRQAALAGLHESALWIAGPRAGSVTRGTANGIMGIGTDIGEGPEATKPLHGGVGRGLGDGAGTATAPGGGVRDGADRGVGPVGDWRDGASG